MKSNALHLVISLTVHLGDANITTLNLYTMGASQISFIIDRLATLPDDKKAALEDEPSTYSVGWSHGKEKFNGM